MDTETRRQELERIRAQMLELEAEVDKETALKGWRATELLHGVLCDRRIHAGNLRRDGQPRFQHHRRHRRRQEPARTDQDLPDIPARGEGDRVDRIRPERLRSRRRSDPGDRLLFVSGDRDVAGNTGLPCLDPFRRQAWAALVRLVVATIVSLAIWAFNFYAILSWLQPLLIGGDPGNWITNPRFLAVVGRRGNPPGVWVDDRAPVSARRIHALLEGKRLEDDPMNAQAAVRSGS